MPNMSSHGVERSAHLQSSPSHNEVRHALDSNADIQQAYDRGYSSQTGSLVETSHTDTVDNASASWLTEPSVPVSHFATSNLPSKPKPHIGFSDAQVSTRQNYRKTRINHSPKEKRGGPRPATYAVLEPVAPMSSTPYTGSRHSARSAPKSSTRRGQSSNERSDDKENRLLPPHQSPGWDGDTGVMHKHHYTEVDSRYPAPSSVEASFSVSPGWSSQFLDASTSSHFPQAAGASIYLAQQGQVIPIYLDDLDALPDEIIALLGTASCHPLECAKWMMVATHYRSKGNTSAALAVITAMIEVMLGAGMEASQLNPAVLMLSSCHLDIAKQLRAQAGKETTESKYHFDKGCEGLRNIYGAFNQPSSTSATPAPFCSSGSSVSTPPDGDNRRNSRQRSPLKAVTTSDRYDISPEVTRRCSQLKILEREVQSLRDRQEDQDEALNHARTAKRKLEDDLEGERYVRRKLERRLGQAESDVSGAQKGENFALAQCRAEVETRRRAEERADEMRQEAAEVRAALEPKIAQYGERERNFKDFFGKLGIVFLKAARGEFGEVLNGRL